MGTEEGFVQVEPTVIIDGGPEFGVNVGAPVRLRLWSGVEGVGLVRREDWDTLSDWGQLVRGLKFGSDNAPLGVWFGALEGYSLLTGHLVRRYMTRGEQVQAVAELTTNLLVTTGTATATTRTMTGALAGAEATVPVLSLSAQGALAIERVTVPVERAAAVLGGGPGAAIILHRANTAASQPSPSGGRGPGQWAPSGEKGASPRARAYQEQISGHSYDEAYWVGGVGRNSAGVKFDGFTDDVLLEAKGLGYAEFFEKNLAPKGWYKDSGKAKDLIDQAERQRRSVRGMGIRIEWHVAEEHAANAIRKLLKGEGFTEITVIHTPARPLAP